MNTPTRELKQLRADLFVLVTMAAQIRDSRETATGHTKLQEAMMHVGNTIHEMSATKVYAQSTNATNNTIDPYHIDQEIAPMAIPVDWNQGTHVQNVKIMRREADAIVSRIKKFHAAETESGLDALALLAEYPFSILWINEALVKSREAMNWFGMELARVRETSAA